MNVTAGLHDMTASSVTVDGSVRAYDMTVSSVTVDGTVRAYDMIM